MNVASLENCRKLFQLSGWDAVAESWFDGPEPYIGRSTYAEGKFICFAYSAGFLLRKLPENLNRKEDGFIQAWLSMDKLGSDGWQLSYRKGAAKPDIKTVADTPEDAACLLAIKLFEEAVL